MGYGGFGGKGSGGKGGGDLRAKARQAQAPAAPPFEGLVDLIFVVSLTAPWGFGFRSEQVNRSNVPTHQSRLMQDMKHVCNNVLRHIIVDP